MTEMGLQNVQLDENDFSFSVDRGLELIRPRRVVGVLCRIHAEQASKLVALLISSG
jgi:hypothetical protein